MRLYILASAEPLFKPRVLSRILLSRWRDVIGVAEVGIPRAKSGRLAAMLDHYRVMGWRYFLFMGFYKRLLTVLARMPIPSFIKSNLSIANACARFAVPCEYVTDVNDPEFIRRLSLSEPDVLVSFQGQIFSPELLSVARIACINCHPSILPKYRGRWPILAAMLNQDATIGVTVHTMTERIDMGTILCGKEFATSRDRSFMDNCSLAHELYAEVILEALDVLESGEISGFPRVPADAPYYRGPSAEDMCRFRSYGLKML